MNNTLCQMFLGTVKAFGERPAIKVRTGDHYEPVTYKELHARASALATAIIRRGVAFQDHVGLISDNRPEWLLCDLACLLAGAADVPRGSDSTRAELAYILTHSDSVAVFVEDATQLAKVMGIEGLVDRIKFLAVMDPAFGGSDHPKVTTVAALLEEGKAALASGDETVSRRTAAVGPDDRATVIYTSGTTGEPKGVILMHRNIMHNVRVVPPLVGINEHDRFLSLLPPWHIFERTVEYLIVSMGASMAYSTPRNLAQDMLLERPTYIASVPRVWEGFYNRVIASVAKEKEAKQKVFAGLVSLSKRYVAASRVLTGEDMVLAPESGAARAVKVARALLTLLGLSLPYRFAQKKFAAIRARTGGCLKAAISGGGALPHYVDEFFAAVGLTILEGYGLTETSPVIAVRLFNRRVLGTVGPVVPEVEVKVVDEHGSPLGPGQKGLIKVRGELVMKGYYKREDLTRQAIDPDGWFDTGDLGMWTVRGEVAIRGRAKETIVLLGGENVEPSPIEDRITESPFISQVLLVGQDKKALGALVVPDDEAVRERFRKAGREKKGLLSGDAEVSELIRAEINRLVTAEAGFRPFEKVGRVRLLEEDFKVGEELTHTLKKRRNFIYEKYHDLIEEMYARDGA